MATDQSGETVDLLEVAIEEAKESGRPVAKVLKADRVAPPLLRPNQPSSSEIRKQMRRGVSD